MSTFFFGGPAMWAADFDSAIRRFDPSRPSQHFAKPIKSLSNSAAFHSER